MFTYKYSYFPDVVFSWIFGTLGMYINTHTSNHNRMNVEYYLTWSDLQLVVTTIDNRGYFTLSISFVHAVPKIRQSCSREFRHYILLCFIEVIVKSRSDLLRNSLLPYKDLHITRLVIYGSGIAVVTSSLFALSVTWRGGVWITVVRHPSVPQTSVDSSDENRKLSKLRAIPSDWTHL